MALLLMIVAVVLFLTPKAHFGLTCVAASLICQFVGLTGHIFKMPH